VLTQSPIFPTSQDCRLFAGKLGEEPTLVHAASIEPMDVPERLQKAKGTTLDSTAPIPPTFPMALAMQSMVEAINGTSDIPPTPDFEQAWQVERVQEAIRLSNEQHRWVKVAEID